MKKINLHKLSIILLAAFFCILSCTNNESSRSTSKQEDNLSSAEVIAHGKYLVTIMGCNDCHSPKQMGPKGPEIIPELMLSGFPADRPIIEFKDTMLQKGFATFYPDLTAAAGPWGMSFAANLTPDESGIGTWTEEQFIKAFTEGKLKGLDNGRRILPPMPLENYSAMKHEDVKAIFKYLKSIKPVSNVVPSPIPPSNI